MNYAIYPGSFDPITNGHLDIIDRALSIFDKVIIAVSDNQQKKHLFSLEERLHLIRQVLTDKKRIEVESFSGLLVNYAQAKKIKVVLRGLRAVSDFEYEFQLANMNRNLADDIQTVFMMTGQENFYVSSSLVREVASFKGNVSQHVPQAVNERLKEKFQ